MEAVRSDVGAERRPTRDLFSGEHARPDHPTFLVTATPEDFVDMIRCLRRAGCDYIIVGAYALAANGHPRATGDIAILVRPTSQNAARVFRALLDFGAPVQAHGVSAMDFSVPGNVYQIGLPPVRIDILTSIAGVSFDEAVEGATDGTLEAEPVRFIGREAQIRNKLAAGRVKDLADAKALEALRDAEA